MNNRNKKLFQIKNKISDFPGIIYNLNLIK